MAKTKAEIQHELAVTRRAYELAAADARLFRTLHTGASGSTVAHMAVWNTADTDGVERINLQVSAPGLDEGRIIKALAGLLLRLHGDGLLAAATDADGDMVLRNHATTDRVAQAGETAVAALLAMPKEHRPAVLSLFCATCGEWGGEHPCTCGHTENVA